jgi:Protein of unknown function (DUF3047)
LQLNQILFQGGARVGIDNPGPNLLRPRSLWSFLNTLCTFAIAAFVALMMLLAGGCASTAPAVQHAGVPKTSLSSLADTQAWQPWILHPSKRKTEYLRETQDGVAVVQARAHASASGLMHRLDVPVSASTRLSWRWKVDELIASADLRDRSSSDSPVRIVLAFDGDKSRLPGKEQAFFERVKLFAGQDMPYATLMYVWDNRVPVEEIISNGHTSRVRKIVASSGVQELKKWCSFQRKIAQDFERAFGEKPGRLLGVALLTDTDNTGEFTTGYYADLQLSP